MLNRIKIGPRIAIAFAFIFIMMIGGFYFAMNQITLMAQFFKLMHQHSLSVTYHIREVEHHYQKIQLSLKDLTYQKQLKSHQTILADINRRETLIMQNAQEIMNNTLGNKQIARHMITAFMDWQPIRNQIIHHVLAGDLDRARHDQDTLQAPLLAKIDSQIHYLITQSATKGDQYLKTANYEFIQSRYFLFIAVCVIFGFSSLIVYFLTKGITFPLTQVIDIAHHIAQGNLNTQIRVKTGDEAGEMLRALKSMVNQLQKLTFVATGISRGNMDVTVRPRSDKDELGHAMKKMMEQLKENRAQNQQQLWFKDGLNSLTETLIGIDDPFVLGEAALRFVCRHTQAATGAFYEYRKKETTLHMTCNYAHSLQQDTLPVYRLGESTVGQTALEQKPILVSSKSDDLLSTELNFTPRYSSQTYCYPLMFKHQLLGVIELIFNQPVSELTIEYLNASSKSIASLFYTAVQTDRIRGLLSVAEQQGNELHRNNVLLEEQQHQLQQTNAQLAERQHQLNAQAEELKHKNMSLEEARQDLLQANHYKSEFLANMSHELRTPLNSIILLSRILMKNEDANLAAGDIEKLNVVFRSGSELLRLINDILDLSKIEAGKMSFSLQPFTTSELVQEFKDMFSAVAEDKGLAFVVENRISQPVVSDRKKIVQVIRNLVSNALKFTHTGSVSLCISTTEPDTLVFTVSDTGIGIPKDKQALIFQAFQQVDGSTSRQYGGTGLGLSISKRIADLLCGTIELESEPGTGTTITLKIPYQEVPSDSLAGTPTPAVLDATCPEEIPCEAFEPVLSDRKLTGSRILIVDDAIKDVFVMTSALESTDAVVFDVQTGQDALIFLTEHAVDVVLMDIVMPVMDGLETIRRIRQMPDLSTLPIIAITAQAMKGDRQKCLKAGATDYLSKPVDFDELINKIARGTAGHEPDHSDC